MTRLTYHGRSAKLIKEALETSLLVIAIRLKELAHRPQHALEFENLENKQEEIKKLLKKAEDYMVLYNQQTL